MSELDRTLASVLAERFSSNAARVRELALPLSERQFWSKPFRYGNSFGHLVLHLTGNLNYYIGANIANTGYIRDRPREFDEEDPPFKEDALTHLHNTVTMVITTIAQQSTEDWVKEYSAVGTNCKQRLDMMLSAPHTCSTTSDR